MINKVIKLVLIAIIGLTYTMQANDDRISKFFEKYSNIEGVTYVSFNPSPALMEGKGEQMENKEAADLMKDINSVKILTTKKRAGRDKKAKANPQNLDNIFQDALKSLPIDEFEKFLEVREGKKEVKMLYKTSKEKNKAKEFLIIAKEGDELSIVWVEGLVDLKDLTKLSKMMNK
ncbi:MAG: DUF4252 domain-containing protein [bacterium]